MNRLFFLLIVPTVLLIVSCHGKSDRVEYQYETIQIELNHSKKCNIRDNGRIIPLEMSEHSLLSYVEQIEFGNNKIFIYDKRRILVFDTNGNFLHEIGKRGQGPGEYTSVNSFFRDGDNVCIYDSNLQTLFTYDENGAIITTQRTEELMSSICLAGDNKYIGRKKFQGINLSVPSLALLDKNLKLISNIDNRYLTSGIGVFDHCSVFGNNILYWEFLNDTIYSVEKTKAIDKYYVDFGNSKIPEIKRKGKDISGIIDYLNSSSTKYAAGVRYVQEDETYVRFIFSFDTNLHYAEYNKLTKKTSLHHFYDPEKILEVQYFMKYVDGNVILVVQNPDDESNPQLLFIDGLLNDEFTG